MISAAVLVSTAFRMRDPDALISALYVLTRAVRAMERQRSPATA